MPGLGDPRFEHAVILVCAHTPEGAMGLIINKTMPDMSFAGLLEHLNIPLGDESRKIAVHFGGPVERGRGFVLHSPDYAGGPATLRIEGGYGMTATLDVLEAHGARPWPRQGAAGAGLFRLGSGPARGRNHPQRLADSRAHRGADLCRKQRRQMGQARCAAWASSR